MLANCLRRDRTHDFLLRFKGGAQHRTVKSLVVDWRLRKKKLEQDQDRSFPKQKQAKKTANWYDYFACQSHATGVLCVIQTHLSNLHCRDEQCAFSINALASSLLIDNSHMLAAT